MNEKTCRKCGETKTLSDDFWYFHSSNRAFENTCKACRLAAEKLKWNNTGRAKRYGLTNDGYQRMMAQQNNACAICGRDDIVLCVDHEHSTGRIRGLLCRTCNVAIAWFADCPTIVERAQRYLQIC